MDAQDLQAQDEAWHRITPERTASTLETDVVGGLSSTEAARRLGVFGPNELPSLARRSPLSMFLSQFHDLMIWILIAAAVVSGLVLKEYIDAAAIGAILLINAILGFVQELRANAAIESLKDLSAPRAVVIRDGKEITVQSKELVPGDVVILSAGDIVAADCRLIDVASLMIDEAALTGESVSMHKETAPVLIEGSVPLGDRKNIAYLGTTVLTGRGRGVVVATGAKTEMGKIAGLVQDEEELTPLQIELKRVGRVIALIVLAVAAIVFLAGIMTGKPAALMFLAAVALAVAAIPEGLPAIVTVTLSIGVRTMAASKAIIRKLHAVETLGATTFIATDKTGTLTKNRMAVRYLSTGGELTDAGGPLDADEARLLKASILASDAHFSGEALVGDPTEVALIEAGLDAGIEKGSLDQLEPRIDEVPFDSARKMMTTLHAVDGEYVAYSKGAPEVMLGLCEMSAQDRSRVEALVNELAAEGLRTLAVGERRFSDRPSSLPSEERGLRFLGFVALLDPPRPEVAQAIASCRQAGIRVAMVTGDHAATARAIGRELGLTEDGACMTGREVDVISMEELAARVEKISIFARVDPAHKLKIVEALKSRGEIVAVTGDGVNDAPALKRADIGVAMGVVGTEVAKEASDMVLADDNFATIVAAVRQGRMVFDNLKKFIHFLLSCNVSEVLTMFLVIIAGLPLPLFPVQLLWINLITDGFPALALGVDPPEGDLMERPPRAPEEGIVAAASLKRLLLWGAILTAGTVGTFVAVLLVRGVPLALASSPRYAVDLAVAQTATFTAMVLQQLVHSLNFRSRRASILSVDSLKNRLLLLAVAGSAALQFAVVYIPGVDRVFKTTALGLTEWAMILAAIIVPIGVIDLLKRRGGGGTIGQDVRAGSA